MFFLFLPAFESSTKRVNFKIPTEDEPKTRGQGKIILVRAKTVNTTVDAMLAKKSVCKNFSDTLRNNGYLVYPV